MVLREDKKKWDGSFQMTHYNLPLVSDNDYNMTLYCFILGLKVKFVIFGEFVVAFQITRVFHSPSS